MTSRLRLLDGVSWEGVPLPGERVGSLLAVLADEAAGVTDSRLVGQIWPDAPPVHPAKALQVLVSRTRTATSADTIRRLDGGYRLGLSDDDVDCRGQLTALTSARAALAAGDAEEALGLASAAASFAVADPDHDGPLADLRRAGAQRRTAAREVVALAAARLGRHAEAYDGLVAAHERRPDDTEVLLALLRTEAVTVGAAAALTRYATYRADLADRLGIDPDPALQRVHTELLSADDPVRTGMRFDAVGLLGREADLSRLRASLGASRLVTVLGPGGIGKTSIAQVLAHESTLPRVHVVELVGVGTGDDVVAAVGGALGVRGSVTARTALTPAQQADIRGRIAQELDVGPTLLVLDNCEHVLEPVASLVAFLLATTRDLRVLATSRAPLRLAAERAVPLSQLSVDDAVALFARRATATRPDAVVDPAAVRSIVDRLDGLPLAIELAAARVRTMTVVEVAAALDDRFATLRSRDRSTPDRHRTLEAVIAWSWDLLTADEQHALTWLSVFQDGVDRATSAAVLGPGGVDLVEALVEQSLLVMSEEGGTSRFRALETIREFAFAQLAAGGQLDAALEVQRRWACDVAAQSMDLVVADDQVARIDLLVREQNNLTDVLRNGLSVGDRELVAQLVALLGSLWTITGDQPRIFAVCDAAAELLAGWDVPARLHTQAQDSAGVLMVHLSWMPGADLGGLRDLVVQGAVPIGTWGLIAHTVHVATEPPDPTARLARAAAGQSDPARAGALLLWAAIVAENAGDAGAASSFAEQALAVGPLPPYLTASLHAELSQLAMAIGDHHRAAHHAEIAWPLLARVHSLTDSYSLQVATAISPLLDGDVEAAARLLDTFGPPDGETAQMGARMTWQTAQAELALARGQHREALRLYDAMVDVVAESGPGPGINPWLGLAASAALVSRARYGPRDEDVRADQLRDVLMATGNDLSPATLWFSDLPLNGVLLVALAAWTLRYGPTEQHEDGVRLLAVSHRWAYNRSIPVMAWEPLVTLADARVPGLADELVLELADRPGPDLVPHAAEVVERLRRAWLTSS